MRSLPCPHCHETPNDLSAHLRFHCSKLYGRSDYTPPFGYITETVTNRIGQTFERTFKVNEPAVSLKSVLPKFFWDLEEFLDSQ